GVSAGTIALGFNGEASTPQGVHGGYSETLPSVSVAATMMLDSVFAWGWVPDYASSGVDRTAMVGPDSISLTAGYAYIPTGNPDPYLALAGVAPTAWVMA